MKPIYRNIIFGALTVGVTITTAVLITKYIRGKLGKGAGQKEATVHDKDTRTITFIR